MDSMKILQKESGITLNTVDNIENFVSDIRNGRWDSVLSQVSHLQLPSDKLVSLFIFYIITNILKLFTDN
jgi:WD40 repeat-containing protein SMU1